MSWLDELSPKKRAIAGKVIAYARKHGVPENVALGMAMQESGFDQSKKSGTGPVGVMQVGRKASKDLKINPKDVDQNIEGGIRYFKQMLDQHGDVDSALVAYHDGPNSPFFKGGDMSPAAKNHIQKVKGYAGMADNTQSKVKVKPEEDEFNVPLTEVKPLDFTASSFVPPPPLSSSGSSPAGAADVASFLGGFTTGAARGQSRQLSGKAQDREIKRNAEERKSKQLQFDVLQATKGKTAGQDVSNYIHGQLGPAIVDVAKKGQYTQKGVAEQGEKAALLAQKAEAIAPDQFRLTPESKIFIPRETKGSVPAPLVVEPTLPETEKKAGLSDTTAAKKPIPGFGHTTASGAFGGIAGQQAYSAIENLMQGNVLESLKSAGTAIGAGIASEARNPRLKAILGLGSAAAAYGPELWDDIQTYITSGNKPPEAEAPPVNRAEGGLAQYGLLHSGQGAKGKGYFGPLSSQDIGDGGPVDYSLGAQPYSTELSAENDEYEYPTMVPGLTREELDHLRAGHEPTDDIIRKAEAHAEKRRASGRSPFSQPDELRYPVPNMAGGKLVGDALKKSISSAAKPAWEYGAQKAGKMSDWAQNYIDQYLVPTQADRMGGVGGTSFSANQLGLPEYAGRAWGSAKPHAATGLKNLALDPRFGGVENQIFTPLIGSKNMHQSNQLSFDALMDEFYRNPEKLTPELRQMINSFMQSGGPKKTGKLRFNPMEGFDIADKDLVRDLGQTFDLRKAISTHAFGGEGLGGKKAQIIPHQQILTELSDPMVSGASTSSLGPRAFRLRGQTEDIPRPDLNKAYPYINFGTDLDVTFKPVPGELGLMDFGNQWRKDVNKTLPLKSGGLKQPGYYEYTMGYKPQKSAPRIYPRQQMTEEWIKELQRSGFAKGGLATV
jgi:hypothetical protein